MALAISILTRALLANCTPWVLVTEYVPAASKVLGGSKESEPHISTSENIPGPPNRPDHDHKIEDFVRDQHRSKTKDGTLN